MKSISDNIEGLERNNSYNTVSNYVEALLDSFMIYKANRYDIKGKEILKTQEKYYAVDIGLRYYILGQNSGRDMGHILENIVYLELGVGGNTPVIIKYPFWQLTAQNDNASYICINLGESYCPDEIIDQSVCVNADIGKVIKDLVE